jgi:hypothetical protein
MPNSFLIALSPEVKDSRQENLKTCGIFRPPCIYAAAAGRSHLIVAAFSESFTTRHETIAMMILFWALTYYGHMLIIATKERNLAETEVLPKNRRYAGENLFSAGGSGAFVFRSRSFKP